MATIDVTRAHPLGLPGARAAAEAVARRLQAEHGVDWAWQGDTLVVDGPGVEGSLEAAVSTVRVRARLGLLMRPFRRALEAEIQRELDAALPTAA